MTKHIGSVDNLGLSSEEKHRLMAASYVARQTFAKPYMLISETVLNFLVSKNTAL